MPARHTCRPAPVESGAMRYWIFKCWRASSNHHVSNHLIHSLLWPASVTPRGSYPNLDPGTIPEQPPDVGDRVALLRTAGRRTAIIATGSIAETLEIETRFGHGYAACRFSPEHLLFNTPILWETVTSDPEFLPPNLTSEALGFDGGDPPTEIDHTQWEILSRHCNDPQSASPETLQWKVQPGQILDRAELHDLYGGTRSGPISSSGTQPHVFLFHKKEKNNSPHDALPATPTTIESSQRDVASLTHHMREGRALRLFRYIDDGRRKVQYCGLYRVADGNPIVKTETRELRERRNLRRRYLRAPRHIWTTERYTISIQPADETNGQPETNPQEVRLGSFASTSQNREPNSDESSIAHLLPPFQETGISRGSATATARSIAAALQNTQVLEALSNDPDGQVLVSAIQLSARLANLRSAVTELEESLEKGISEEPFYQEWCESHSWAFGNAYSNRDAVRNISLGDQVDILMRNTGNGLRDIFELKRPDRDPLGWDQKHKSYYWTPEASKAIGQCHRYMDAFHDAARNGLRDNPHVVAYHPRVFIIQGRSSSWGESRLRALHGLNTRLHGVQLMTYDQLLTQAKRLIELLTTESNEGNRYDKARLEDPGNA